MLDTSAVWCSVGHMRTLLTPAEQIENLEDEFNAYAAKADEAPHRWGEEQEAHMTVLQRRLRKMYDANNVHDYDRIQGV